MFNVLEVYLQSLLGDEGRRQGLAADFLAFLEAQPRGAGGHGFALASTAVGSALVELRRPAGPAALLLGRAAVWAVVLDTGVEAGEREALVRRGWRHRRRGRGGRDRRGADRRRDRRRRQVAVVSGIGQRVVQVVTMGVASRARA